MAELETLNQRWESLLSLFGDEHRSEMEQLWDSNQQFAVMCQDTLIQDVFLRICRVTDPAGSGKFVNVSLGRLSQLLNQHGQFQNLADRIDAELGRLGTLLTPIRDRRNQIYAHADEDTRRGTRTVAAGNWGDVGKVVGSITDLFVEVHRGLTGDTLIIDGRAVRLHEWAKAVSVCKESLSGGTGR